MREETTVIVTIFHQLDISPSFDYGSFDFLHLINEISHTMKDRKSFKVQWDLKLE